MTLDPEACYRALRTRDARFDGRFFVAVRSTGIYCRPVCPARTPLRENCLFLRCAAAAEAAGFRPCRRCRPEAAPGTAAWVGTSATVSRGLRLIDAGALDAGGVGDLATRLGVGERHLRRLFVRHVGAAPLAIARTRRAHFAAQLLAQTDWPMSRVAFAAGYTSVRRFNEALRRTFACTPRALRERRRGMIADGGAIRLRARPPWNIDGLLGYLAPRAVPGVETVGPRGVRRALRVADTAVVVETEANADGDGLAVRLRGGNASLWLPVAERVRAVFDLGAEPSQIREVLERDPLLRRRLAKRPGVRVPGAWEPFEMAARIVLGQQVTVAGATRLAARVVERFGEPLPASLRDPAAAAPTRLFPAPERLADAALEEIGLPRQRARALRALAAALAEGTLDLGPGGDAEEARASLLSLPGVGPWTAEMVLLRGLGEPDAFPAGDLGLQRALGLDADALSRRAEGWRPWRGYAAMLLWTTPERRARRAA